MTTTTTQAIIAAIETAGKQFTHWDWNQRFPCICSLGKNAYDGEISEADLITGGHDAECAERMSELMKRYALEAAMRAKICRGHGDSAITELRAGKIKRALFYLQLACQYERDLDDCPSWSVPRDLCQRLSMNLKTHKGEPKR